MLANFHSMNVSLRWRRCAIGIAFLSGTLIPVKQTSAFKPDEPDHGHMMITKSILTNGYSYKGKSVANFSTILSTGRPVSFSEAAANDVVLGNSSTDWPFFAAFDHQVNGISMPVLSEFTDGTAHCDNESLPECSQRIATKLNYEVLDNLRKYSLLSDPDRISVIGRELIGRARLHLGKALHTLQDFYAHSDHTNRKSENEIYTDIYALTAGRPAPFRRGVLSSGLYSGRDYNECAPAIGGNYDYNEKKPSNGPPTTGFFAPEAESTLTGIIVGTAYASARDTEGSALCDHGSSVLGVYTLNGVNKDAPNPVFHGVGITDEYLAKMVTAHVIASYQAAQHTARLMTDLVAAIKSYPDITDVQRDAMITGLLGVDQSNPVYGFVVDTTGSMTPIIDGVKAQIQKLIDDSVAAGKSTDQKFLLLDYGDPYVGEAFVGTATQVKAKVSTLVAFGGDDCPELTQSAVLRAIAAAPSNSALFAFTDASAKDSNLGQNVVDAAKAKKIAVTYVASGSCSPIDPSYYAVAAATGGQVLVTDHTAAGVAAAFTGISIETTGSELSPVVIERGTLSGPKTVNVTVESGASKLSMLATSDAGAITFRAPDGGIVASGAAVVITDFLGGRGIKVNNPAAGVWKVEYSLPSGTTPYSVKADVASKVSFAEMTFTSNALSGRQGHESYAPYSGMPPLGAVRYRARLKGSISTPVFEALSEDGSLINAFTASQVTDEYFSGAMTLGAAAFRVRVSGVDGAGKSVIRILPTLYTPRKLDIRFVDAPRFVLNGANKVYARVTNPGAAGTVSLSATTNLGTMTALKPSSLSLATGDSALVELTVTLPASADAAARPELSLSAVKDAVTEKTQLRFDVFVDTDGDGIPDIEEMGPTGADPLYDGNGDGIPDYMQPQVLSLHSRSRNAYVTMSIDGPGRFALASAAATPADSGGQNFPVDLFDLKIVGLGNGAATKVKIKFQDYLVPHGYSKYGPLPTNALPTWYSFSDDGTTGATFSANVVTLSLVDGGRGDGDLTKNGEIVDIGGPTDVKMAGVKDVADAAPDAPDSGGGGIGYSWLIMLLVSTIGVWMVPKRMKIT